MVEILEAKQLTEQALFAIPGVQGVGVGGYSPKERIRVYVDVLTPEVEARVPRTIAGYSVELVESGRFKALSLMAPLKLATEPSRTSRLRPAPGGCSIAHYLVTAGTLGGVINGLILSNNHILANSSTFEAPAASAGDPILQPGPADSGTMDDQIATLQSYVPLSMTGLNLVDVAWARPLSPDLVSEEILGLGFIQGVAEPVLNMQIQKSGRTTAVTTGSIIDVNATVTVEYGSSITLKFTDQVVTSYVADAGDSGSLGLDMNNNLWGLLFAGSNELSLFNKVGNVFASTPFAPLAIPAMIPLFIGGVVISHYVFGVP